VKAFLDYNVVANALEITTSKTFEASDRLALVDGSIAEAATAAKIAKVAKNKFKSIDALVNNAGIYLAKHFTDYTVDDLRALASGQSRRFSPDHPDGGQADAGSEHRREHRQCHCGPGESSDRGESILP
jgi:hypothetical protein